MTPSTHVRKKLPASNTELSIVLPPWNAWRSSRACPKTRQRVFPSSPGPPGEHRGGGCIPTIKPPPYPPPEDREREIHCAFKGYACQEKSGTLIEPHSRILPFRAAI